MRNKEIKETRIKGYFIQATKEILKAEGLMAISVRNVAERAGYSYATLYNYFNDINELIFECVADFKVECAEFVSQFTQGNEYGIDRIKVTLVTFADYFIQYPGVFELFFLERITGGAYKKDTIDVIYQLCDYLCDEDWNFCARTRRYTDLEIRLKKEQVRAIVVGLLVFYLNRRQPETYPEFKANLNEQLDYMLK